LNLRKDLASRSGSLTSVKHGEKLEVLEWRRRFVRVRTKDGTQGWTDANLLFSSEQMDSLRQMGELTSKLPSLGRATVFDVLNVHSEPSRQSPSFFQIPEGGSVEVIGHRIAPRIQSTVRPGLQAPKRAEPPKKKPKAAKAAAIVFPTPKPPAPPQTWLEMSRPHVTDLPDYAPPAAAAPVPLDDWNLVRAPDGTVGWVLARMLFMAIPDEVAQYAEGHRIVAYLPLDPVSDGGQMKQSWLWATAASNYHASDFDSFRVFVWSLKHHRYETGHVERNVAGHFPMQIVSIPGDKQQGFSVVIEDKDGTLVKRTYSFAAFRVKLLSKEPVQKGPDPLPSLTLSSPKSSSEAVAQAQPITWWLKIRSHFPGKN
jgi:hypothetical protein